jgi:phosphoribosylanthranilate isomerase
LIKVKICGVTNSQDALWAANLGADFIGLNFYPRSPRKISAKHAKEIVSQIPPFVTSVGLFVDEPVPSVAKTVKATGIKAAQLHGNESVEICGEIRGLGVKVIKAFRLQAPMDVAAVSAYDAVADYFLFDFYSPEAPGGTGEPLDPEWLSQAGALTKPWFLAGGLQADTIAKIVEQLKPPMVDVCSGVERMPTRKDYDAMKNFIQNVRSVR